MLLSTANRCFSRHILYSRFDPAVAEVFRKTALLDEGMALSVGGNRWKVISQSAESTFPSEEFLRRFKLWSSMRIVNGNRRV